MAVFSLHWLRGPEASRDRNFELLCLDLLTAEFPKGNHHRLGSPDSGIDILWLERTDGNRQVRVAYQCKAYERYSASLVAAVSTSLTAAIRARTLLSPPIEWGKYVLLTPLLLTAKQRLAIESIWTGHQMDGYVGDIDWIERLLFRHEDVRSRFFPDFRILLPPDHTPIRIGFPETTETVRLYLYVHRFGQRVQLLVPSSLTVETLIDILVDRLALPIHATVRFTDTRNYAAEWDLRRSDQKTLLERSATFESLKVPPDLQVELTATFKPVPRVCEYLGGESDSGEPPYCEVSDKRGVRNRSEKGGEEFIWEAIDLKLRTLFPAGLQCLGHSRRSMWRSLWRAIVRNVGRSRHV